jgi:hypothetical protein
MLALMELAHGKEVGRDRFLHPDFVALRSACIFFIAFVNDIFSYHKEVIQTGNLNNAIAVVQMQFHLSFAQAATAVVRMAKRCFDEFEARAQQMLDDGSLSEIERHYIQGVSAWMAGAMKWTVESERYRHPDSPFPELRTRKPTEQSSSKARSSAAGDAQLVESASERGHRSAGHDSSHDCSKSASLSATVTKRRTASI